ncbi:MAG TPA: DUF1801 domain-containing protein [Saprospiraceae bacterium]|nr:DUF1801 domain-containing protein [Saprospiraceae bacterium]HNM26076.1 DUF1801 domain-containing protein [Saprospiraceae bacterium]
MTDADKVSAYMQALDYPLKAEVELLRDIIRSAHPGLSERIKWNAPSYYTQADLLTFNLHDPKVIRLVFHHPAIVEITSPLLQGEYKDRRLAFFESRAAVDMQREELVRVVRELIKYAER